MEQTQNVSKKPKAKKSELWKDLFGFVFPHYSWFVGQLSLDIESISYIHIDKAKIIFSFI